MPRTKDPIARLAIIDRFLCGKEALTLTEITNGVNEELIAQHQPPIVKPTIIAIIEEGSILNDILSINEYHIVEYYRMFDQKIK